MKLTRAADIEAAKAAVRKMLTAAPANPLRPDAAPMTSKAYNKPLVSLAAGCHPMQVQEFNEEARKAGLTGVYYDERGNCHFSSRGQRREWNKYRGLVDKDGGYSD